MKTGTFRALILIVAVIALAQMLIAGAPTGGERVSTRSLEAVNPGIYVFYDWDNLSPADYPWITGGVIIRRWSHLDIGMNRYDWSQLETWTAREASLGKRTILRVSPHDGWDNQRRNLDGTPAWVYGEGVPQLRLADGALYPQYWHPTYRAHLAGFIAAFGARYDGDPRVEAVEVGIGLYGEAFPGPDDPAWAQAGLSRALWKSYVIEVIDAYAQAFMKTPLILMEQMYPQGNFLQMGEIADYAAAKGVHMGFNGVRAEDQSAWSNSFVQPGWHRPFGKWVMTGERLGRMEAHGTYYNPDLTYWAVLNALDSNASYISLYVGDVADPRNAEAYRLANKYAGRTILNTPSLWVALRDETPGLWQTKPNNYGLGLTQYDPDNTSIGLWNVGGKEGRFARRTDLASGRRHLSFDVHDGYLYQSPGATVDITITYLDQGYDTWELQYDSAVDRHKVAGVVTKGNTGEWKKEIFLLHDARFGNRQAGNSDFLLYSNEDGDDIFHMIELTKYPLPATPLNIHSLLIDCIRASSVSSYAYI